MEAEDGVVEVSLVLPHVSFPWRALKPGPRRWAPTDLFADVVDEQIQSIRMTYRTVGDRVVVVAGMPADVEVDWTAERLATPLLFAHYRRTSQGSAPASIMSALNGEPMWQESIGDGWTFGQAGVGPRPVRLAHLAQDDGHIIVGAHGIAAEELTTLVAGLEPIADGDTIAVDLHKRHRRALAQRWWDAPRAPWRPDS